MWWDMCYYQRTNIAVISLEGQNEKTDLKTEIVESWKADCPTVSYMT